MPIANKLSLRRLAMGVSSTQPCLSACSMYVVWEQISKSALYTSEMTF